ncbi:hypothetical protein M404DRAFT_33240 [Pisolithus tinctorius Marx 270]|uniref:Uncharacterized protein n=1 Tax=Pisolithus tinctorius Marx 270 TaxID=870435 RepID=A0A0C3IHF6_PISTI|nr:hypothetical protein M404DRAFT_33240 [Pisolithus tinctorius Marx 270]
MLVVEPSVSASSLSLPAMPTSVPDASSPVGNVVGASPASTAMSRGRKRQNERMSSQKWRSFIEVGVARFALWCIHQPPSPSDDAVVPQVPAPVGAAQPPAITDIHITALTEVPVEVSDSPSTNVGGLCTAAAVENTHPCSPVPSPGDNGIPIRAPSQGSPSNSTGALAPALIEAQPTGLPSSQESADTPFLAHTEEVLTGKRCTCDEGDKSKNVNDQCQSPHALHFA